jgi:hypothetical protein
MTTVEIRTLINLLENAASGHLYRWVDAAGVAAYIKADAMKARHRHVIPQLGVQDKPAMKKGLSFSRSASRWDAAGDICFVVDEKRLPNKSYDINGQQVYNLTQEAEYLRSSVRSGYMPSKEDFRRYKDQLAVAVQESRDDPDEVFVVGDLKSLSVGLVEIRVKPSVDADTRDLLTAYSERHGILVIELGAR